MKTLALVRSIPLTARPLGLADLKLYAFSALFAAGNLLVPLALHTVPNGGPMFLPLFFFTLVAGWQFGALAGVIVALVSPVLNHLLAAMPTAAMLPVVLTKSVVLALAAVILARSTKKVSLWGLALAVVLMQTIGFGAELVSGTPWAVDLDLLVLSVPGMLIMVFGGYTVLRLMNRKAQ